MCGLTINLSAFSWDRTNPSILDTRLEYESVMQLLWSIGYESWDKFCYWEPFILGMKSIMPKMKELRNREKPTTQIWSVHIGLSLSDKNMVALESMFTFIFMEKEWFPWI